MNELKEKIKTLLSRAINAAEEEKEAKNEKVDKRKLIDEVAGIMKSAGCDDEAIRTAIGKMEKIGYDESETDKADNKCKNEDEEKEKEFEEEKEIANKKAKNEEKEDDEEVENKCKKVKNSIDETKKILFGGIAKQQSRYLTSSERIELGNQY